MRTLLLSAIALILGLGTASAQELKYEWPFDGSTQEVMNSKHGTPVGNGVNWVDDADRGQVLQLSGEDSYIQLPSPLWEEGQDTNTTITCWYNWAGGAAWQRLYSFGRANVSWDPWGCQYYSVFDGTSLHITFLGKTTMWYDYPVTFGLDDPMVIDQNKWYFTAIRMMGDSVKIWINDQVILNDTIPVTPQGFQWADTSENVIGKSHWADQTFNGMIDDFRIYWGALNDQAVANLFWSNNTSTPPVEPASEIRFYGSNGRIMYSHVDESQISRVEVYSLTGSLMFRSGKLSDLNGERFNPGMYLVRVRESNKAITRKVVLSR